MEKLRLDDPEAHLEEIRKDRADELAGLRKKWEEGSETLEVQVPGVLIVLVRNTSRWDCLRYFRAGETWMVSRDESRVELRQAVAWAFDAVREELGGPA